MRSRDAWAMAVLLATLGCGDDDQRAVTPLDESAEVEESRAEARTAPEPPSELDPRRWTPPDPRGTDAGERLGAFRRHLGEGRRLARAGNQLAAIREFRQALQAADDPAARCELGWALFRAEQLDEAARELDVVLRGVSDDVDRVPEARHRTYGACLYNRGRVAQARGNVITAAQAFRRSLALRPNATVQAALDALEVEAQAAPECETVCEGPFDDRATVERSLLNAIAEVYEDYERCCDDTSAPLAFEAEPWMAGEPGGPYLETAAAQIRAGACYSAPELSLVVAVSRSDTGWSGCVLGAAWGGVNEALYVDGAPRVEGGALRVDLRLEFYDVEAAGDCNACVVDQEAGNAWEGDEACVEACADYNTEQSHGVELRLAADGRLGLLECPDLAFD